MDDYIENPAASVLAIKKALNLPPAKQSNCHQPGFIKIDHDRLRKIRETASDIQQVLSGNDIFKLAETFDLWSESFLDSKQGENLVRRYREYWKTSSHIAFDVFCPAEDDIISHALTINNVCNESTLSFELFHQRIKITSRSFTTPTTSITHGWGSLEKELVVPCTPYYLRATIAYLNAVLDSFVYDP